MNRKLFYIFNFLILAIFALAAWMDYSPEWKKYQRRYYQLTAESLEKKLAAATDAEDQKSLKVELRSFKRRPLEIKQIIVKDLGRVDRCITCHVGMDSFTVPTLTNDFAENPYKAHPDLPGLVKAHPFLKYGCTSCHAGQGLVTTTLDAHGELHGHPISWEHPLLKPPYIQASCAKCHGDFETLPGAQVVAKGRKHFEEKGCLGCHSVRGVGQTISVDLGDIADKPLERIARYNFSLIRDAHGAPLEENHWTLQNWIEAHLTNDPQEFVPNDPYGKFNAEPIAPSGMPPYHQELKSEEAKAIVTYLLSLTAKAVPHKYYVYASPKPEPKFSNPVEHGKHVFNKYGCAGCHGQGGTGGRRNFNALGPGQSDPEKDMDKGKIPTLVDTAGTFTREELKLKIQNGVSIPKMVKFDPQGPDPPLYMPAWKEKIKDQELENLITYLLSIAKKDESF